MAYLMERMTQELQVLLNSPKAHFYVLCFTPTVVRYTAEQRQRERGDEEEREL